MALQFDQFGKLEEPDVYCSPCLMEVLKSNYQSLGDTCSVCEAPMELRTSYLEDDFDEGIVWYYCKHLLEAENQEEYEDHDELGEYLVQPEAD